MNVSYKTYANNIITAMVNEKVVGLLDMNVQKYLDNNSIIYNEDDRSLYYVDQSQNKYHIKYIIMGVNAPDVITFKNNNDIDYRYSNINTISSVRNYIENIITINEETYEDFTIYKDDNYIGRFDIDMLGFAQKYNFYTNNGVVMYIDEKGDRYNVKELLNLTLDDDNKFTANKKIITINKVPRDYRKSNITNINDSNDRTRYMKDYERELVQLSKTDPEVFLKKCVAELKVKYNADVTAVMADETLWNLINDILAALNHNDVAFKIIKKYMRSHIMAIHTGDSDYYKILPALKNVEGEVNESMMLLSLECEVNKTLPGYVKELKPRGRRPKANK